MRALRFWVYRVREKHCAPELTERAPNGQKCAPKLRRAPRSHSAAQFGSDGVGFQLVLSSEERATAPDTQSSFSSPTQLESCPATASLQRDHLGAFFSLMSTNGSHGPAE